MKPFEIFWILLESLVIINDYFVIIIIIIVNISYVPQYTAKQHHNLQVNQKVQFIDKTQVHEM